MRKPSINIYSKNGRPCYMEPSPGNSGLDLYLNLPDDGSLRLMDGHKVVWDTGLIFDLSGLPDMMGDVPIVWDICVHIRSSISIKHGVLLANQVGIIDQSYNGPEDTLKVVLRLDSYATKPNSRPDLDLGGGMASYYTIKDGERAVQLIVRMAVDWSRITLTSNEPAGASRGGIGSTGV